MKFTAMVFLNENTSFFTPAVEGDRLILYTVESVTASSEIAAAEFLFAKYNQDERPFRKCVRSVSCGDVFILHNDKNEQTFWSVAAHGFHELGEAGLTVKLRYLPPFAEVVRK